jgi:hypothetical protein
MREGILLLGTPSFLWAERDAFDPAPLASSEDTLRYTARLRANHGFAGFVLSSKEAAIPVRPPSEAILRKAVAARGAEETIHAAWLAPSVYGREPDEDRVVWYAERRGEEWTIPERVFAADRLDWSGQKPSLLINGRSEVHLLVAYVRREGAGIAYVRRLDGRWKTTQAPLRGLPSQVTAQLIGNDSLVVAFAAIGKPGVRGPSGQHIYLVRIAVSDTSWPSPQRVQWSGLDALRWLTLYTLPSGSHETRRLALVWGQIPQAGRRAADTLYSMLSEDGGATWKTLQKLPVPFGAASVSQAQDTDGNVHVVLTPSRALLADNAGMHHALLRDGAWTALTPIPAGPPASTPALSAIGQDTLILVWGEARPARAKQAESVAPVSKYAFFVRSCS